MRTQFTKESLVSIKESVHLKFSLTRYFLSVVDCIYILLVLYIYLGKAVAISVVYSKDARGQEGIIMLLQ